MDGLRIKETGEVELELTAEEARLVYSALVIVRMGPLTTPSRIVYSKLLRGFKALGVKL